MIFLGDFVYPFKKREKIYEFDATFLEEEKMLNLEGAVLDPEKEQIITKGVAVYSSKEIYSILDDLNVKAVGLANNHITDFDFPIHKLKDTLSHKGILSAGAGSNIEDALKPILIEDQEYEYAIYCFGWNIIGCKSAKDNMQGVAPLEEESIIGCIKEAKTRYPNRKIVLFPHWNIEYEYYPQPADRDLAFKAIDAGADIIIGHHPHIVGVYEVYKGKPIFYSVGNFMLPDYDYNGFYLESSERAKLGLGIGYSENLAEIMLYWIKSEQNILTIDKKEKLTECNELENITELFQDNLQKYKIWFKKHRRKKKLLPVFVTHQQNITNSLLEGIMYIRNILVHFLTKNGLRKKNN